jgi:hypothetical protein
VSIAHRLGTVPIGEASIVIAVSAGHRGAAWKRVGRVAELRDRAAFEGIARGTEEEDVCARCGGGGLR